MHVKNVKMFISVYHEEHSHMRDRERIMSA